MTSKAPIKYSQMCSPVQLIPELAQEVGIPCALLLRQLEYWIYKSGPNHSKLIKRCISNKGMMVKNHRWVKDSYKTLQSQLKCISYGTVKKSIYWLRNNNYIFVSNSSFTNGSHGINWYSLNFNKLNRLFNKSKYTDKKTISYVADLPDGAYAVRKTKKNKSSRLSNNQPKVRSNSHLGYKGQSHGDKLSKCRVNGTSPRGLNKHHPSNETNEINNETSSEDAGGDVGQSSNNSFNKMTGLYEKLFSSRLSSHGLEIMDNWTNHWDDVLLKKSLYDTDAKIKVRKEPAILKYISKILTEFRAKGITDVAGLYRFKAQQRKQFNKRLDQQYANDGEHGGTASDMQTHTFYQQMCQVVAGKRTGNMLFPKVTPQDKENGKLIVKACYIVMRQKHTDNTADVDFEALAENNCAKARQVLGMDRG